MLTWRPGGSPGNPHVWWCEPPGPLTCIEHALITQQWYWWGPFLRNQTRHSPPVFLDGAGVHFPSGSQQFCSGLRRESCSNIGASLRNSRLILHLELLLPKRGPVLGEHPEETQVPDTCCLTSWIMHHDVVCSSALMIILRIYGINKLQKSWKQWKQWIYHSLSST